MGVSKIDGKRLVTDINAKASGVPGILRRFIPPLPQMLRQVPQYVRKYSVEELIEFLEAAHRRGDIDL